MVQLFFGSSDGTLQLSQILTRVMNKAVLFDECVFHKKHDETGAHSYFYSLGYEESTIEQ